VSSSHAAVPQAAGVSPDRRGGVRVHEPGLDDILLEVTFWTDSRRSDFNDTASNVHSAIIAAFKREGIGLPNQRPAAGGVC
jgi:small conductance mechanosensitive channel